jgi:hypothetical protein
VTVGAAFAAPLVATVTKGGTASSGVVVTFAAPASGASGTFAGGVNTATTNASGVATSAVFAANTKAGAYAVTASAPGAKMAASFSLTNNAGPAATITATGGASQSATVSTAFAAPLAATVVDSNSNPVSGAVVTFTAPGSGASGTFAGGANTATTNASGVASSAVFTANATAGGPYIVTAKVAGVATAANFSLTNTALVTTITATSGTPQSANVSTAFAAPLVATVKLGANPVSGAVVTFTPPASGASGTFAGGVNTATTNASGVATSAVFTANATAGGPYNVVATTPGAAAPANFSLTNLALVTTITATSGTPQSANVSTAFAAPLVATVKLGANPVSGAVVTFTPPASGASGTFAGGVNTATTNASGVATSAVFTANATVGGPYNVVATTPGAAAPANFSLTNTAVVAGTTNYVFYLSGADVLPNGSGNYNFYALAGAITVDANGTVAGGEQDYNEGFSGGVASPEPSGDTITGGTLTVSSTTGQGTLTLVTNNSAVGVNGTETFAIQFVNANHALIMQFDGSATSSGSMDVQSAPATPSGKFAFSFSGVDQNYNANALGGVFSVSSGVVSGVVDQNDSGTVTTNVAFSGTFSAPDAFGRGSLTINGSSTSINYYDVNPKVARIITVDTAQSSVGSAYSQGAAGFTNASLPSPAVFTDAANPWGTSYGAMGMFTTSSTGSNPSHFTGVADNNQLNGSPQSAAPITGNYSIAANGYGSFTIASGNLSFISALGIYLVDPTLNINDPNNTASGLGGALVLDLDPIEAGGGGVLIPQTSTATAAFTGKYALGWQNFNTFSGCGLCEFDFLTPAAMTGGVLSGTTGQISDPFETLIASPTDSGVTMSGTPTPDGSHPGHYTNFSLGWFGGHLNVAIYQASGGQLFILEEDNNSVLVGPIEQQGSLTGIPAAREGTGQAK